MPRGGGPSHPKRNNASTARRRKEAEQRQTTSGAERLLGIVDALVAAVGNLPSISEQTAALLQLAPELTAADLVHCRCAVAAYVAGGVLKGYDADRLLNALADLQTYREEQADAHAAPNCILVPLAAIDGPWTSDEIGAERSGDAEA